MPAVHPAPPPNRPAPDAGGAACATCGAPLGGPFCSQCGQRVRPRLTLGGVAREAVGHVLSLDSALLRTAVDLVRRPAGLVRDVLAGRTVRYAGPVRYFLVAVTVAQVLSLLSGAVLDIASGIEEASRSGAERGVGTTADTLERFWVLGFVGLVPFVTLWSRLLLRRSGLTLAEHAAAHLYLLGQVAFFVGLSSVVENLVDRINGTAGYVAALVLFAAPLALYLWASVGVFGRGRVWSPVATALSLVFGQLSYGFLGVGLYVALSA